MTKQGTLQQVDVMPIELAEHGEFPAGENTASPSRALLDDIKVVVDVTLGTAELTVKQLMALKKGSVVELQQQLQQDVNVLLNGKVIARGEIVAVDEYFGVRITEIPDAS